MSKYNNKEIRELRETNKRLSTMLEKLIQENIKLIKRVQKYEKRK